MVAYGSSSGRAEYWFQTMTAKGFLTEGFAAEILQPPGSGLGLHVAQHVARANSSRLSYERRPRPGFSDQGYNVFSLVVPGGDSSS
jgi:hypothetical protein